MSEFGYTDLSGLEGGIAGWREAGCELFSGVGSYSKAFGEWIAEQYRTPYIKAEDLHDDFCKGRKQVILDCRPYAEYHRMTIPGSISAPGADLVYRVHEVVKDPSTMVVVHCAGRTRSIIGTQSLVNTGIPNTVAALQNGTMGWQLAGFELEYGQTRKAPLPSASVLAKAREGVERTAERFGVRKIDYATLEKWMNGCHERTLYVIDVRLPEEFQAGHLEGTRNVQGGQLIQATDEFIGVFNSRIVLVDDNEIRATVTASWMIQMGWPEVYVLQNGIIDLPLTQTPCKPSVLGLEKGNTLSVEGLQGLLGRAEETTAVIDVSSSRDYSARHIPGARWAIRSRLGVELSSLPRFGTLVFVSENDVVAHFAARDLQGTDLADQVLVLDGGTTAWVDKGLPASRGMEDPMSEVDDLWYMPYLHPDAPDEAKREYFEWEYGLVAQIERDGTAKFQMFPHGV